MVSDFLESHKPINQEDNTWQGEREFLSCLPSFLGAGELAVASAVPAELDVDHE